MDKQGGPDKTLIKTMIILLGVCAGFFCFQKECWAIDHLVISEIHITGGAGKTKQDFIELYNPTDGIINLKGYRLVKRTKTGNEDTTIKSWTDDALVLSHGYYLWGNSIDGFADSIGADASTSQTIADDNGIALRFGKEDEGKFIDSVGWGNCENIFIEDMAFPANPDAHQSLERKTGIDTNNNSIDFFIQENPNPQNSSAGGIEPAPVVCGDGNLDAGEECDDANNENGDGCDSACRIEVMEEEAGEQEEEQAEEEEESEEENNTQNPEVEEERYNLGDVVINELVSDPGDGEVEWIELYNKTGREIDLSGWTIAEGSGARTGLEGKIGAGGADKFFVLEKPKGNLNNQGEIIILRDQRDTLIDQVVYGDWDDGNPGNNAPAASDPNSLARKFDGQNSYNNFNDFSPTAVLTKGESNVIVLAGTEEEEVSAADRAQYDYSPDIVISEIFPNPAGSDSEDEFIELYNRGARTVDLSGWRLGDGSKKRYTFTRGTLNDVNDARESQETLIKAGGYLVVYRSVSGIALNNSSDEAKLFRPLEDDPCQTVKYENVVEGWSFNLRLPAVAGEKDKYVWSEAITPGEENIIKAVNHSPEVAFDFSAPALVARPLLFDSSDTVDLDDDALKFSWDFGDQASSSLACPEHTYFQAGVYTVTLRVTDGQNEAKKEKIIDIIAAAENPAVSAGVTTAASAAGVIINEILPAPEGADNEEEWIELKNAGAVRVNLLDWQLDDGEGGSRPYVFASDLWLEPGEIFLLERPESGLALNNTVDAVRLFSPTGELVDETSYEKAAEGETYARGQNDKWFWTTTLTPGEENIIAVANSQAAGADQLGAGALSAAGGGTDEIINTTLEKIRELESGERVRVQGVVAVEPGVLGTQYFYIVGSPGIQVYNYKKEFPDLAVGDYLEVSGELSVVNGEQRLKTKSADDMKIVEHREAPAAVNLSCESVTEELVGSLISVTGEVVDRKSSTVYLDDGTNEIMVYIKSSTGIDVKAIAEGEMMTITGIVGRTASGIRLLPRSSDDIIKKDPESSGGDVGQVLGEIAVSDEWEIAARDKKLELFRYLLVTAGAVIIILGGLLVKAVRGQG